MGYGGKQASRSGDIRRFNFTGNGSNTAFDLGFTPATQNQLIVTVNGLVQHYDAFSISGTTLTFTGTPASGDAIQVTAVVDAVGVAGIPDGAVANVSTLTVSGNTTLSGAAVLSSTANVAQGLTANTITISTNTATIGTALYSVANGNIGINTTTPNNSLDIKNSNIYQIRTGDGSTYYDFGRNNSTGYFNFYGNQTGYTGYLFGGVDGTRMTIDSAGRVTMPRQPAFQVRRSASDVSNGNVVVFDAADVNIGSYYSTSTGRFTAPVAGTYSFTWHLSKQNGTSYFLTGQLRKNGTNTGYFSMDQDAISYSETNYMTILITLAVNDYVEIYASGNSVARADYVTSWCGHLVG